MSLMRLLSAGKSLIGASDNPNRYRMRHDARLPVFGSSKNPFAKPAKTVSTPAAPAPARMQTASLFEAKPPQPAPPQPPSTPITPAQAQRRHVAPQRATVAPKPAPVNNTSPAPAAPKAASPAPAFKPGPVRSTSWISAINPFSWLPARAGKSRRNARVQPVQTEMALENVKVVRNDLNDADLEVVSGKLISQVTISAPDEQPAAVTRTEPTVWGRLASLYMDVEKTHS
jgi:hypothetical protein